MNFRQEPSDQIDRLLIDGALAALDEAVLIASPDREILWMNCAGERLFGYSLDELRGQTTEGLHVDLEHHAGFGERIRAAFSRGQAAHFEFPHRRKSGEVFPCEHTVSLVKDDAGRTVGIASVIRDITERKRVECELERTQQELHQAGRLAAMGELGAGIAHELNQPLAAIEMLLGLILDAEERPIADFAHQLGTIREQILRMAKIVDNVRGFARKSDIELRPIHPLEPLEKAVALISNAFRLEGIELVYSPAQGLPLITGDSIRLQQVFLNLLTNARQAFERAPARGPKRVLLRVRALGSLVEYSVEDTAGGIPPEVARRMFEPFFTTKATGHGTGLGLSLAYGIVRDHKGSICHDERTVGTSGTRFVVAIPATEEESPAAAPPEERRLTVHDSGINKRIVVVDDDECLRNAIVDWLNSTGWEAMQASSGEEGLAILAQTDVDVALIDLKMPGMGGVETCRAIRETRPATIMVAMSGFATEEDRARLRECGVVDLLTKPMQPTALTDALLRAVGHGEQDRPPG